MVFKFERKSTEKKCEKRKNRRLLWKKFCNSIDLPDVYASSGSRLTVFLEHK